jgi:hypothetical protein
MQLFMNERVDKLNSLTGSGLAACLQEAEESVLPCRPSPALFHSITSFDQMRNCGDMLEKMDFEVDGEIDSLLPSAVSNIFLQARNLAENGAVGARVARGLNFASDTCGCRCTVLESRLSVQTSMPLRGR